MTANGSIPPPTLPRPPGEGPLFGRLRSLTSEVATHLLSLATSALGLVAALAWNDAVQALFKEYFPAGSGVVAKFLYAVTVTVIIVVLTINLSRLVRLAKSGTRDTKP